MTAVVIRGKFGHRGNTRENPCEDGGTDWTDGPTNQGTTKIASTHQKLEETHGPNSSSEPPVETNLADSLISDFWLPEL